MPRDTLPARWPPRVSASDVRRPALIAAASPALRCRDSPWSPCGASLHRGQAGRGTALTRINIALASSRGCHWELPVPQEQPAGSSQPSAAIEGQAQVGGRVPQSEGRLGHRQG